MRFSPSSSKRPSPTATTLPFCGFSLAVSGRTMPLAVVSSSSIGLTISRSPRGFSFIRIPPFTGQKVRKLGLALCLGECQRLKDSGSAVCEQPAAEQGGDSLATASHHPVVIPLEDGPGKRRRQVHPGLGGGH